MSKERKSHFKVTFAWGVFGHVSFQTQLKYHNLQENSALLYLSPFALFTGRSPPRPNHKSLWAPRQCWTHHRCTLDIYCWFRRNKMIEIALNQTWTWSSKKTDSGYKETMILSEGVMREKMRKVLWGPPSIYSVTPSTYLLSTHFIPDKNMPF